MKHEQMETTIDWGEIKLNVIYNYYHELPSNDYDVPSDPPEVEILHIMAGDADIYDVIHPNYLDDIEQQIHEFMR